MKDFYFVDRSSWHLLGIATANGGGKIHIVDDTDDQLISAGARTYSGTILFTPELSSKVQTMAARGNYILYMDERNKAVFMTIMESSHDPLAGEETFTAEDAGIDLINETVGPYKAQQAMGIADYISLFTNDSGFEIGLNEIPNLKRTLEWTGESDTTLNRILSVATQFDNAELDFSFDVSGTTVVRRLINIHKRIGADRNITLYVDKDINKIVTSGSIYDLYTAVTPTGGTPESKNGETADQQPITLQGYQWTDPDGRYVLTKEGVLLDPVANQTWSRLLAKGGAPSVNAAYINRVVTYTATSQATLLQSALSDLKTHNHEAVNYETDIAVLPQNINIGDTIHLADENEQLYLSARLLELKSSYSMDTHTATLGDYLIEHDQVAAQYRQLAEQIKNIPKTVQYYPWIRYADDDKGTNMSALPAGKKYMAVVYSNKSSVPSDNPDDYAGKWALIKGADGADGVPGAKGADGRTSYFHTAWADDVSGKSGFTVSGGDGKKYIGTYSDFTQADSTNPADYNWALFKGDKGDQGPQGPQGPQGVQGVPGSKDVPYTYIQLGTPASPKKGDLWWHGTTLNDATALQYYNGTAWIDQSIQQAVLSIKKLQSIEVDTSTINSPTINSPFSHVQISGAKSSGNLSLSNAALQILGNIEDNSGNPNGQYYNTILNPSGMTNYITTPDQKGNMSSAGLQNGALQLQTLISDPSAATKKYIQSEYKSTDNVSFFYVNSPAITTANMSYAYIYYMRRNNIVTVQFVLGISQQKPWVVLADVRPGYKPYAESGVGCYISNTNYVGQACQIYVSKGQWVTMPTSPSGECRGSVSYLTQDDYPTGDSYFS